MKKKLIRKWDTGTEHDRVPKCGGGDTAPKTMNTARFYLLFILTSILHANFLAQTISEINREYWN